MMQLWNRLSARINALTMRERFLLFACVIAMLGGATNLLFISPLIDQQKILVAQIDRNSSQMDLQRDATNLEISKRRREQLKQLDAEALKLRNESDLIEKEIATLSAARANVPAVSTILRRVLHRSDKVTLVRVVQVGTELSALSAGQVSVRSGLEVTLTGNYLDLMRYLALLERELPQARWGSMLLKAEGASPQITLRIFSTAAES